MLGDYRKYGVALAAGTPGSDLVRISLRKSGSDTFATGSDYSPAAGDWKVSKNGGAQANITTLPSYSNGSWEITLSASEMSADMIRIVGSNASIINEDITLLTYGNPSAFYPGDYGDVVRLGMSALPNAAADADGGLPTIRTVSKIVHGTKCWYVQIAANGGSDSNAGTAAAPFLTIGHACSAAAAGDTILVGGGSFAEVDFNVPANARLIGSGMGVTIVTSTSANDTICRVSSGSMVADMTIKGTAGSGIFQYAVGDNGATATDVLILRVGGGTDSDFKYFTGTGSTYRAIECEGTGHWDEGYEGGTNIIGEEWRCTYRSTGPNTEAANNGSVISVGGQNNVLRLFDPKIIYTDTASNTNRTVEAVRALDGGNANANNRIEIYRGSISVNVPDGTIRHFRADDGCTITVQDTSFDPSKVAQHFVIYGAPTGGTYSITVTNYAGSQTASGIAYNASDATVQAALAALSNVGAGNVTVSGKFITFTPAVGAVSLSAAGSFTGGTSPAIYIGNVLIQNTPINQASQIAPGALASGALMPETFASGVYPMQVGPDFTNVKQATGATTLNNLTIPTVTNLTNLPAIPTNWLTAAGINAGALDGKGDWLLASGYIIPPTVAQIATGILTDTTAGDLGTAGSLGKVVTQWGTMVNGSNQFTTSALANGPAGSGGGGGSAGTGNIAVNHNTGGTDNLRFIDGNGNGIDEASVTAYLQADWTANELTAVARGQAFTGTDGRWATPMMLNAGTYVFVFEAAGYQVSTVTAIVS